MENWQKAVNIALDAVVFDQDGELQFVNVSKEELAELIHYAQHNLGGSTEDAVNYVGKCCVESQQRSRKRAAKTALKVLAVPFILVAPIIIIGLLDESGVIHLDYSNDMTMVLTLFLPWVAEFIIYRLLRRRKQQTPEYQARMLWRKRSQHPQSVSAVLQQMTELF